MRWVARLYRSSEVIAQIRLSSYGLVSSDIDTLILSQNNVSQSFINLLENQREDGKNKDRSRNGL